MTNLFVRNLSFYTTDTELASAFEQFGAVERASVVRDRDSGQSRGFGFVEMTNSSDAENAINGLDGQDLDGRAVSVSLARPRESNGGSNRRPTGAGYGGGRRRENRY